MEPNDEPGQADQVDLGEHAIWGSLSDPGDLDYYALSAESGDILSVTASSAGDALPTAIQLELFDSSGVSVASGTWSGEEEAVMNGLSLSQGEHLLVVSPVDSSALLSAGNFYQLDINHLRP